MTDWVSVVTGQYRTEFVALMRELPFGRIRHLPQSKRGGLPFGREAVVLQRFLRRESNALNPSGVATLYRATRSLSEQLLFRGFVLGEVLSRVDWALTISIGLVEKWERIGLLRPAVGEGLAVPFRVIPVGDLLLLTDALDERFRNRVHIGQDSINTLDFLRRQSISGRLLDVGTGTGVLLLSLASRVSEAVGVDINPRAVELARLNAEINGAVRVTIEQCDAFAVRQRFGTFDCIVWNAPFVFFPPDLRAVNLDGDGGDMGIELTLRFVEELPGLLRGAGRAHIMSAAPILRDGRNPLEDKLRSTAANGGLDVELSVVQKFWDAGLRDFHAAHGIARFESVILTFTKGAGRLRRHESPLLRRGSDALRRLYYEGVRQ